MLAALERWWIRKILARHEAGDVEGTLKVYASDVRFVFPGNNSWACDIRGKEAIAAWLRRFHGAGLKIKVHDVLIAGPPWNTRVGLAFTDHLTEPSGRVVYENRGVIYGTSRWGKFVEYTVFEDTEKVAALDLYLAEHGDSVARSYLATRQAAGA